MSRPASVGRTVGGADSRTIAGAPPAASSQALLTTAELAAYINRPPATLRYWRHRRYGPQSFPLGRIVVYRKAVVDRWLADQERAAAALWNSRGR